MLSRAIGNSLVFQDLQDELAARQRMTITLFFTLKMGIQIAELAFLLD